MKLQKKGTLFIVSAPSGAGKSSLINAYLKQPHNQTACVSISHTTRQPRLGEVNGQHYYFVSKLQFESLIASSAFVEYALVFDNYYGTSKAEIDNKLINGVNVFLDIDWQGARQVREIMPDAKSIFIMPPSLDELKSRLIGRSQDSIEVINDRMQKAKSEMIHFNEYEFLIINDDFNQALNDLTTIVSSHSLMLDNQKFKYSKLISELLD